MTTASIINLVGLLLNILGTVILSFAATNYMTSIHGTLAIHDKQMNALIIRDDKILVADIANLLRKGVEDSRKKTRIGFTVLVMGFAIQLVHYILEALKIKI